MITALDLGSMTGVAWGEVGDDPRTATWRLKGASRGERGAFLSAFLLEHIMLYKPTHIAVEAPMALAAMMKIGAQADTLLSLYGYSFLVETIAFNHQIATSLTGVQKARRHFIGYKPSKGEGKNAVMARCQQLGWHPMDTNQSDALALWDYTCSVLDSSAYLKDRLQRSVAQSA